MVAEALGDPLLDWQQLAADVLGELDPTTGRYAYPIGVVSVPRQQGKTVWLRALRIARCLTRPRLLCMDTAQDRQAAADKLLEAVDAMEASPQLSRLIKSVRRSNGSERVTFKNGSQWRVFAPTKKAGHGTSPDLVTLDEAWAIDAAVDHAMRFAQRSRPMRQMLIVSTAGDETSTMFRRYVVAGREAAELDTGSGVAHLEWAAGEDDDPADPSTWWAAMPALGILTDVEAVELELATTPLGDFTRGALNVWTRATELVIPPTWWAACATADKLPPGPLTFAADVDSDRSGGSIAAAMVDATGLAWVELVEHRDGTEWIAPRLAELARRWSAPIVVDNVGPSSTVHEQLGPLGIVPITPSARQCSAAFARLYDHARDATLRHRDQDQLNEALRGARRRPLADGWAWDRKHSAIAPLTACTLALWAAETARAPGLLV